MIYITQVLNNISYEFIHSLLTWFMWSCLKTRLVQFICRDVSLQRAFKFKILDLFRSYKLFKRYVVLSNYKKKTTFQQTPIFDCITINYFQVYNLIIFHPCYSCVVDINQVYFCVQTQSVYVDSRFNYVQNSHPSKHLKHVHLDVF